MMGKREKVGELQKVHDYDQWVLLVKAIGADKILEEYGATTYPNNTYAVSSSRTKYHGHWNSKTQTGHVAGTLLSFSTTRRKFKEVRLVEAKGWVFKSSKGDKEYEVTQDGVKLNCTCPGYTFRRKCKHVTEIYEKLANE